MTDIDPIELEQMQRAFDRLPPRHAAIFSAARHDCMTYVQIAQRTGLTRKHVQRIVADALFRLQWDVCEQQRGITIGPIRRYLRERHLDVRLFLRIWRDRV